MQDILKELFKLNFRLLTKKESVDGCRVTIVHYSNQSCSELLNINHPEFDKLYFESIERSKNKLLKKIS